MIWEQPFLADAFPQWGRSVHHSDDAGRYLIDQVASSLPEAPKSPHRESGEFVAALVEGHLSRTTVVIALARLRVEAADPSRSTLPVRMWTPACGSAYVTASMSLCYDTPMP